MANGAIAISALNACTTPAATDALVLASNTAGNTVTMQVSVNNVFNNAAANLTVNVVTGSTLVVTGNSTPANNTDNDSRANGAIWADGSFVYYWDGTTITRATLSAF
jgi:hypothetical protein